jgi:signal transduction histidine kinase
MGRLEGTSGGAAGGADAPPATTLSRLAAGLSHELRNPLNTLSLTLQFLERLFARERALERREEIDRHLSTATREIDRIQRTIEAFVDLAKPGAAAEPRSLDLARLAAEAAGDGGSAVRVTAPKGPLLVRADPDELRLALDAVIENAREASPEGRVELRVEREGRAARVTVADAGPGFCEVALARASEPFFSTKAGHEGLGLARAQLALEPQGGRLSLRNAPGGGAEVTIELDLFE